MRTIQVNMVQHGINYDHLQKLSYYVFGEVNCGVKFVKSLEVTVV